MLVATVLTACGIETVGAKDIGSYVSKVATVLTACGIETHMECKAPMHMKWLVATVLTACGIETLQQITFVPNR